MSWAPHRVCDIKKRKSGNANQKFTSGGQWLRLARLAALERSATSGQVGKWGKGEVVKWGSGEVVKSTSGSNHINTLTNNGPFE